MEFLTKAKKLSRTHQTPFLAIDLSHLRKKYQQIAKSVPNLEVFYAVKANDDLTILNTLRTEGCSFDVASEPELDTILKMKVPTEKIICLHTIKSPQFLHRLEKAQVDILAIDSKDETDKIAKFFPTAKLVLRLTVDNSDSDWPLTKKFGLTASELLDVATYIKRKKLNIYGLTFHVGSQCRNKKNWTKAIKEAKEVWLDLKTKLDISVPYLSLGGGLPINQTSKVPGVAEIGTEITKAIKTHFGDVKNLRVSMEPGRGLIGDSGIMVSTVVGKALREGKEWVYLDVGVFNGLMETIEDYKYEVVGTKRHTTQKIITIAGPSCDSVDVMFKDMKVQALSLNEKVFIINCGAYTTVYASNFNGFPAPKIIYV